jgi:hypothetical protein
LSAMRSCYSGGARGEKIARNCEDWRLGEELTRKWRTVAALGRNSSEGGASSGWRQWSRHRERGERCGAREGGGEEWVTEERQHFGAF